MAVKTPLWLQKADDLDPDIEYTGADDRQLHQAIFTEGILTGGVVSERGAGANFTVDVSIFTAIVDGDDSTGQGAYLVWSDAIENVTVPAAPGSDSRIDRVVLEVNDEQAGGSAGVPFARVRVIAGTPAGSPVAPAEPDTAITLATIGPITPATTSITNASGLIVDARPLARLRHQTVGTSQLVDAAVTTAKITDANVTTAKIADSAVTTAKIADSAVTSAKIADGTIVAGDLASNSVTTAKITDANVTEAKLATAVLSSAWTTLTPGSGWSAASGALDMQYKKVGNIVYLVGAMNRSGASGANQTMATLPAGFRPSATVTVYCDASTPTQVRVLSTGVIQCVQSYTASNHTVSMVFPV